MIGSADSKGRPIGITPIRYSSNITYKYHAHDIGSTDLMTNQSV